VLYTGAYMSCNDAVIIRAAGHLRRVGLEACSKSAIGHTIVMDAQVLHRAFDQLTLLYLVLAQYCINPHESFALPYNLPVSCINGVD